MEIEMKAKINTFQIKKLLGSFEDKNFLQKEDIYYSNGKIPIRLRKEKLISTFKTDTGFVELEYFNKENELIKIKKEIDINVFVLNYFFDFNKKLFGKEENNYITIKEKHIEDGAEINKEYEDQISSYDTINVLLQENNYNVFYKKEKRSISFYTNYKGYDLHLEIVSVNGSSIYLEIETITENIAAKETIKKFFKEFLSITEFDSRKWPEILGEE